MVTIRNASDKARRLPSGATINPGDSRTLRDEAWEADKANPGVAKWLAKGLLVETDGEVVEQRDDQDEADVIIGKLAEYGITKTRRSSIESLRAALDKAEAGE